MPFGSKLHPGCAETDRSGRHRPNAAATSFLEQQSSGVEGEEVDRVDQQIHTVQERIDVGTINEIREDIQFQFGIDVAGCLAKDGSFRLIERADRRAELSIEVAHGKLVGIGDPELADPQSRERHQVQAANSTHAGNRHTAIAQSFLFAG